MQIIRVLPIDHQKGFSAEKQIPKKILKSKNEWSASACEAAQKQEKQVLSDTTILKIRAMREFDGMTAKQIHEYFPYISYDRITSICEYATRAHLIPTKS